MIERLANVLYWFACIMGGMVAVIGIALLNRDGVGMFVSFMIFAFIIWAIGWVLRYVLIGRGVYKLMGGVPAPRHPQSR